MARVLTLVALSIPLFLAACATAPRARPPEVRPESRSGTSALSAPTTPDQRAIIVEGATAMLGQPYRWGGAAPGGFDCSGLVVYAVSGTGIPMPRTAAEQIHAGAPVSRSDVRAGDLVFMHLAHKELHVGIALGNDTFIHAPATGGHVRVDSLNATVYARGYLTARRIVGVE